MALSRGRFLRSLGASMAGKALDSGLALAENLTRRVAELEPASDSVSRPSAPAAFIRRGPDAVRRVALTFDDGPAPGTTGQILDVLRHRGVPATFFMIGEKVPLAPELARRVRDEGHEIGNHTFTHPKLAALPPGEVDCQLERTQDMIYQVVGQKPRWFRPPYGAFRENQASHAARLGLGVIFWSLDTRDWSSPGERAIVATILEQATPGSIIVCHDTMTQTANCLGEIIDGLRMRDLEPVSLSVLLNRAVA